MKVIFLDIDGVLLTTFSMALHYVSGTGRPADSFDPLSQELFENFLLENPDVRIVLSSTWRLNPRKLEVLAENSPLIQSRIVGQTERSPTGHRGTEIMLWLCDNYAEEYAVIDDDSYDIRGTIAERNFVHTEFTLGLQEEHIQQLKGILKCS